MKMNSRHHSSQGRSFSVPVITSAEDIRKALKVLGPVKVAVAYVGAGWQRFLSVGQLSEIIVSPTLGSNPKAIENLIEHFGYGRVHFLNTLHSKIYVGKHAAIVGSCNLSDNGMGDARRQEVAVLVDGTDALETLNTAFDEYKRLAKIQYPNKAAKLERLKWLALQASNAEWHGVVTSGDDTTPSLVNYASQLDRIHVSWYQPIDIDYATKTIHESVPDSLGTSPEDYFEDVMTFLEQDEVRPGDWVLCWQANDDGRPRKKGDVSWMHVHHVIPKGSINDDYTKLVGQSKSLKVGAPPFRLDAPTKQGIRDALSSGLFPDFVSVDESPWEQPSADRSRAFLKHVTKLLSKPARN